MLYTIRSIETNEVIAVCPDRDTAEVLAARSGAKDLMIECVDVDDAVAAVAVPRAPYTPTEWARRAGPWQGKQRRLSWQAPQ